MKLSILIVSLALFSVMCGVAVAQSKLPADVPSNISIYFHRDGGMAPHYRTVTIKGLELKCEGLKEDEATREDFTATISQDDLKTIYKLFVKHRFDLIKNLDSKGIVYDAPVQRISLDIAGDKDFDVSTGGNHPLSENDGKAFKQIADAINAIVDKYAKKK